MPWLRWKDVDIWDFRNFIDRSSFFYFIKTFNKLSPYKDLWDYYTSFPNDFFKNNDFLDKKYRVSSYFETTFEDNYSIEIYDWVSFRKLILPKKFRDFLDDFKSDLTLKENMKNIPWLNSNNHIMELIENYFLVKAHDEFKK